MVEGKKAAISGHTKRRSPLRIILSFAAGLFVFLALFGAMLIWYVQPSEELDLKYSEISFIPKIKQMIKDKQLAMTISEQELDQLLKQALAKHKPEGRIAVTGIRSTLDNGLLRADVNLIYNGILPIGASVAYQLTWRDGSLTAQLQEARIKRLNVPASWIDPQTIAVPLDSLLPGFVTVKDVAFAGHSVSVHFAMDLLRL